jgi:hypothetical protein
MSCDEEAQESNCLGAVLATASNEHFIKNKDHHYKIHTHRAYSNLFLEASKACCCDDRCGLVESVTTDLLCGVCRELVAADNCANRGKTRSATDRGGFRSIFIQRRQQKIQMIHR